MINNLKFTLLFSFLLSIVSFHSISGQETNKDDNRLQVGISPFSSKDIKNIKSIAKLTPVLKEQVLNALSRQNRFQLIDIDGEGRRLIINNQNVRGEWIEDETINPKYTLTGILTSVKFIRLNSGKGYKSTISYSINISDTETGEIINNGTAVFNSSKSEIKLTPESAFLSAVKTTIPGLNQYFTNSFPIEIQLVQIEKSKNNKALEVVLKGGSRFGVKEKMTFEVYYIDESLGEPIPKFIGKVKISKILNENFSSAKVMKGQKEIYNHFNSKKNITCKNVLK